MTKLAINTGSSPNDKSADSLYSAFTKVNNNFTELYRIVSVHLADDLTGTIPDDVLANSTMYIGTTPIELNRKSHELTLLGVNIDGYSSKLKTSSSVVSLINSNAPLADQVLTAIDSSSAEWRTIKASSASSGENPPLNSSDNDLWFDSNDGRLYIKYSNTWVDTNPEPNRGIGTSTTMSDTPPNSAIDGDLWFDTTGGRLYIRYSNSWIDTNP